MPVSQDGDAASSDQLEEAAHLSEKAIVSKTRVARSDRDNLVFHIMHLPCKQPLLVMIKRLLIVKGSPGIGLLRLFNLGDKFCKAMTLGLRIGVDRILRHTFLEQLYSLIGADI